MPTRGLRHSGFRDHEPNLLHWPDHKRVGHGSRQSDHRHQKRNIERAGPLDSEAGEPWRGDARKIPDAVLEADRGS